MINCLKTRKNHKPSTYMLRCTKKTSIQGTKRISNLCPCKKKKTTLTLLIFSLDTCSSHFYITLGKTQVSRTKALKAKTIDKLRSWGERNKKNIDPKSEFLPFITDPSTDGNIGIASDDSPC